MKVNWLLSYNGRLRKKEDNGSLMGGFAKIVDISSKLGCSFSRAHCLGKSCSRYGSNTFIPLCIIVIFDFLN